MDFPVAEIFQSIQGEGQWVGTPMLFVRTAGCNVGKPAKALKVTTPFPMLPVGREASACTTFDGRIFPCDTDYNRNYITSIEDVIKLVQTCSYRHVCVTGGEPFLHSEVLEELFYELASRDIVMHVETSGTIMPNSREWDEHTGICPGYWLTCAPKLGALSKMIERADELKLLVDENFDVYKLTPEMREHRNVFLCPINSIDDINNENVKRCVGLLNQFPHWRMSVQIHKFFNWR